MSGLDNIDDLTTHELHEELRSNGLGRHLLDYPSKTKAQLKKILRKFLQKGRRTDSPEPGEPNPPKTPAPAASSTKDTGSNATAPDSSSEDEESDSDVQKTRLCSLRTVLSWLVRAAYALSLLILIYEMVLAHWKHDELTTDPNAVAATTAVAEPLNPTAASFYSTRSCVITLVIVFTTYLIMHRALFKTNTNVYWLQVSVSLFWMAFLLMLMNFSPSCPPVWYHVEHVVAHYGLTEEFAVFTQSVKEWFVYLFVPRKGGDNFIAPP